MVVGAAGIRRGQSAQRSLEIRNKASVIWQETCPSGRAIGMAHTQASRVAIRPEHPWVLFDRCAAVPGRKRRNITGFSVVVRSIPSEPRTGLASVSQDPLLSGNFPISFLRYLRYLPVNFRIRRRLAEPRQLKTPRSIPRGDNLSPRRIARRVRPIIRHPMTSGQKPSVCSLYQRFMKIA